MGKREGVVCVICRRNSADTIKVKRVHKGRNMVVSICSNHPHPESIRIN
jgi:hypothetical protein